MTSQKIANIIPLTCPDFKNLYKITKIPQNCQNFRKFLKLSKLTNCKIVELAKIVTIAEIDKIAIFCSHYLMSVHIRSCLRWFFQLCHNNNPNN